MSCIDCLTSKLITTQMEWGRCYAVTHTHKQESYLPRMLKSKPVK